jgi:hypothetical protein
MDITHVWRTLCADPAALPQVGAHLETAGQEIATTISQECVVVLPRASYSPNVVTITVTSHAPELLACDCSTARTLATRVRRRRLATADRRLAGTLPGHSTDQFKLSH